MATVKTFEELKCWQRARELVTLVYALTSTGNLARDFGMRDQLQRAALSVMNNIAEGFARESTKEFIRFLDISHASCIEVKSMSYVLEDLKSVSETNIQTMRSKLDETSGLIRGLMKYLRSTSFNRSSEH
ncbi:MAG: four helix bundle protein [Bacteroidota bacterium]